MPADVITAWPFPSSQGTTTYETVLYKDGRLSCSCPGWTFARGGQRACKHTRSVAEEAVAILAGKAKPRKIVVPTVQPPGMRRPSTKAVEADEARIRNLEVG